MDQAAKEHDLLYADHNISTKEADDKFLENTKGTGFVGGVARPSITAKRVLGLDDYFPGDIYSEQFDSTDSAGRYSDVANMETCDAGQQNSSEGGDGNGWTATVIGQVLPGPSSNFVQKHTFNVLLLPLKNIYFFLRNIF